MTNTGAVLWIYKLLNQAYFFTTNFAINDTTQLGFFTLRLTMISGNNITSTATVNTSSLVNITSLSITCEDNDNEVEALLVNGVLIIQ